MYRILENRYIYNFVQKILSLGRGKVIELAEKYITETCNGNVLDIGCGTARYAHLFKENYTGIDINRRYLEAKMQKDKHFVCCDASVLPFKENLFDSIFSVGFFHHIDFRNTVKVFKEIIRITKPNGTVLIIDAFFPDNKLDVLGYLLIKCDRGKYVRDKEAFISELEGYFQSLCPLSRV